MRKYLFIFGVIGFVVLIIGGWWLSRYWNGLKPILIDPKKPIAEYFNDLGVGEKTSTTTVSGTPLILPTGFTIDLFANNVIGARDLAVDQYGEVWVSQPSQGVVSVVDPMTNEVRAIFRNLNRPHGLVFHPQQKDVLYIAEEERIVKTAIRSEALLETVVPLPAGGRHWTRSLVFTSQEELLVSIGSTCDVCEEKNSLHGTVQKVLLGEGRLEPYARGLRNAVFMAVHPKLATVWVTEMGRDMLGDNLPPDEINVLQKDGFYGWPYYYGNNIRDQQFKPNVAVSLVYPLVEAKVELPAHVAPLGLAFVPKNSGWPKSYVGDLLVAYHGSWNRTDPVGYKIVRVLLDDAGNVEGIEDFITGWLTPENTALGRPVDVVFDQSGNLYISDDKAGVVYRVRYTAVPKPGEKDNETSNDVPATDRSVRSKDACVITGCSGEVCADEETITACIYREEYACYQTVICERQAGGECGWSETEELRACLQ